MERAGSGFPTGIWRVPPAPPQPHAIPLSRDSSSSRSTAPQLHIHPTAAVTGLSGDYLPPTAGTPPLRCAPTPLLTEELLLLPAATPSSRCR
jgi:hypothetical protein